MQNTNIIWEDSDRKLYVDNGTPTLLFKGNLYSLGCQPYEPMVLIRQGDRTVVYIHNAFNPDEECQEFLQNSYYLVRTITGKHHNAERFCRLLTTAVEYFRECQLDEVELKMQQLLVQEKGINTIQFETRNFKCDKVLFEGVYVLLGHFENDLSRAYNVNKIYSIAFGYPNRNTDYFEYFYLSEQEYLNFNAMGKKRSWKCKDDAWNWKKQKLDGKLVLCDEFGRNSADSKPCFTLSEVPGFFS